MRKKESIYNLITSGKNSDLEYIQQIFLKDPSSNMYQKTNPEHIINKLLWNGQTPLYVASKHGNVDCVKLLIKEGANPFIKSKVGQNEEESVLSVVV